MEKLTVTPQFIEQLADSGNPALRVKVLTDLLDVSNDDSVFQEAKDHLLEDEWIAKTLQAHNGDGTWGKGFYRKYDGTSWVMLHLSEIGAPADHPAIQAGVNYLLENAKPISGLKGMQAERFVKCTHGYFWEFPAVCLMAHMACVLNRYGQAEHEITRGALEACRSVFDPEEGFGCTVMEYYSLLPACVMTVPKIIKGFLSIPESSRTEEDRKILGDMVALMKKFHLYKYAAHDHNEWYAWCGDHNVEERRREKKVWLKENRHEPRLAKPGWLRFSFPLSYNSDLLETLELIGEVDTTVDDVIEEGMNLVLSKRLKNGMWKMVGGLNGKMYADIDKKGQPSPWITFKALKTFKRFGLLEISE